MVLKKGRDEYGALISILEGKSIQCDITYKCRNNQCFYRQRDQLGRQVWYDFRNPNSQVNVELDAKYGPMIYPLIKVAHITNGMVAYCEDVILEV